MRILAATLLALALPTAAHAAVDAVPGELIVKYRDRGTVIKHVPPKTNLRRAARDVARDTGVVWAQPNYYQRGAALPNDELYGRQWSLPAIGAPAAWDHTTRLGRRQGRHRRLRHQRRRAGPGAERRAWTSGGTSCPTTGMRRTTWATAPTSRASSRPGATTGSACRGVAWRASLIPVRVLDNMNIGTCDEIAQGMAYAVQRGRAS